MLAVATSEGKTMPQYAKQTVSKHERDRARRQYEILNCWHELEAYSNPVAPPQHENAVHLDAWANHVAQGYIVR